MTLRGAHLRKVLGYQLASRDPCTNHSDGMKRRMQTVMIEMTRSVRGPAITRFAEFILHFGHIVWAEIIAARSDPTR